MAQLHHHHHPSQMQQSPPAQPGVGKWTREEHQRYLQAIKIYPQGPWQSVANYVGTRSARQTQTHAQKYREKVSRRKRGLLRKRAMSDEWLENHSSSSEEKFYTNPPQPSTASLPALSATTQPPPPLASSQFKSFSESHLPPPPRLPVLEPLHSSQGTFHLTDNSHHHHHVDKAFPPGGYQASMMYPSMYHTSSHHHSHQQAQSYHQPTSSSSSSYGAPHSHHSSFLPSHHPSNNQHGHRVAPPLEELLQFFVDDVEFMAHRDRQLNPQSSHVQYKATI
ncbi:Aste57867_21901 [Aphanomyces stellatus]|uniref:Aste57867_21901 protein n=1 Tax=Aphanomyces stellatus TaxID=120398 RepID=A0A485LIR8_9STRA|nr:hypothetical protein As57867_021832 [Aphanomyces stellatus]VFT98569.1 Aste57867_21901 [Aphanomyces stellatus]